MKGMRAKVKATGEIVEVREWRGASDVVYSTLDMNRFFAAEAIEFVAPESESLFGWIARDSDGELYYYDKMPKCHFGEWVTDGRATPIPKYMFPNITWDSGLIEVELIIKPIKK